MRSISTIWIVLFPLFLHVGPCDSQEMPLSLQRRRINFRQQLYHEKNIGNSFSNQSIIESSVPDLKKPALGILFSTVIPGTGEIYAGSWIKGAFFLGVEIAFWAGYKHYADQGQDWDNVFHIFADQHWSEPKYWVFIAQRADIPGVTNDTYAAYLTSLRSYEREHYSHTLHEDKDQQYYEMIGKYDQFRAGWDDFEGNSVVTPNRNRYLDMRNESNKKFKHSSACIMGMLANHVLSAFDAAWTVKSVNKKIKSQFRVGLRPFGENVQPWFSLQLN